MLRRLPDLALLAGAVFLEWLALREIAGASRTELHFAHFVLEHASASILAGYSARRLLPPRFRDPALWVSVFIGVFCLFLPVFGLAATLALLVAAIWMPARRARDLYGSVAIPRFSAPPERASARFGEGGIRSRLHAHEAGVPARLKTLLAVQAMPTRQGNRLMREVLNDASDDIRLLAYGMLDRQEKSIAEAIHAELGRLASASGSDAQARHHRRLAFLFWEQVYQELVEGDLRRHAVEQAVRHAEDSLASRSEDAALWSLLGQARIARGELAEAARCLERAEALGAPHARTRPWLAELAFRRRDFPAVRRLLASSPALAQVAALGPVLRFWKTREIPA